MKIVIIGETCIDEYVYGSVDRICPEAPVACFNTSNKITSNLGMASNVKNNLEKMCGFSVDIITNTTDIIKRRFIDSKYNTIVFRQDINDKTLRINLTEYELSSYDIIIISDYCKGFLTNEDIIAISSIAPDATVFIDTKKKKDTFVDFVDYIKINQTEFTENFDSDVSFLKNSRSNLIITAGANGSYFYNGKESGKHFPTRNIELRDVCGAGDTFLAALVAKYLQCSIIEDSISFANECATCAVERFGVCVL